MTHRYFQTVAGAEDTSTGDATKIKWEFDEDLGRYYVSFQEVQEGNTVGLCLNVSSSGSLLDHY